MQYIEVDMIEIERAHKSNWFHPDTMRFFKSRIGDTGYKTDNGYYFISSEKRGNENRYYTIRHQNLDGHIKTVGEFQDYTTKQRALTCLKHILKWG